MYNNSKKYKSKTHRKHNKSKTHRKHNKSNRKTAKKYNYKGKGGSLSFGQDLNYTFGNLVNNQFVWLAQDFFTGLSNTINGTSIPASSNPTLDNFGK